MAQEIEDRFVNTSGYLPADTSSRKDATIQKIALANALAVEYCIRRDFQEVVLRILRGVGSSPDLQLLAIEKYLDSLPYRREPIEILRDPLETLRCGGDCDDLATAFVACANAVAIPAETEAIENSKFDGFHLRAIAYLPPQDPEFAIVFDPVYRSEREWVMHDHRKFGLLHLVSVVQRRIRDCNSKLTVRTESQTPRGE